MESRRATYHEIRLEAYCKDCKWGTPTTGHAPAIISAVATHIHEHRNIVIIVERKIDGAIKELSYDEAIKYLV